MAFLPPSSSRQESIYSWNVRKYHIELTIYHLKRIMKNTDIIRQELRMSRLTNLPEKRLREIEKELVDLENASWKLTSSLQTLLLRL